MWSQPYFGLKCLGITPNDKGSSTIRIQFRWTPYPDEAKLQGKIVYWNRDIDVEGGEARTLVEDWKAAVLAGPKNPAAGVLSKVEGTTNREIETGWTIEIRMSKEDALNMKVMLDLQWAAVQMASISGDAGLPAFLDSSEDDELDEIWINKYKIQ